MVLRNADVLSFAAGSAVYMCSFVRNQLEPRCNGGVRR
jgi:hypothetical protein